MFSSKASHFLLENTLSCGFFPIRWSPRDVIKLSDFSSGTLCDIKNWSNATPTSLTSAKDLKISAVVSPCIKFNILIRSGLDRPRFGGRGSIILPPPIVRCAD